MRSATKSKWAVLAVIVSLSTGAGLAQTIGPVYNQGDMPVPPTSLNTCWEETVVLAGSVHFQSVTLIDADGGVHTSFHTNDNGDISGVGETSGIRYKVTGSDSLVVHKRGPAPVELTQISKFNVIAAGSASNLIARVNFHMTVNASGELTATVNTISFKCTKD